MGIAFLRIGDHTVLDKMKSIVFKFYLLVFDVFAFLRQREWLDSVKTCVLGYFNGRG